jgi:hypothetical protein
MRWLPFEPLPADRRALRLRGFRDGLIISGWLTTAFVLIVVAYFGRSLGYDAYSYWSIDLADLYGRTMSSNFALGAFRYAPPIALLFAPLGLLPWWLFLWLWLTTMLAIVLWLGRRWALVLLALPAVALELYHGNVHLLMAAALALGFRHPWAWSFVVLTKLTPGIGLLWFAVRRDWRALGVAIGATVAASLAVAVVAPHYWTEFVSATLSNIGEPQHFSVPPPLPIRLPLAALLVIWGARTDRPWTVALAATLALPIVWVHGLTVALGAVPILLLGDRAAQLPGWRSAARLRDLAAALVLVVGLALIAALLLPGPISQLLEEASRGLVPLGNRP